MQQRRKNAIADKPLEGITSGCCPLPYSHSRIDSRQARCTTCRLISLRMSSVQNVEISWWRRH